MTDELEIEVKPFEAMTPEQLHACLQLRGEVFVVEQKIHAVADVDAVDLRCVHVMMRLGVDLIGTARLLVCEGGAVVKVGRVAVDRDHRGRGYGRRLMRAIEDWIKQEAGRVGVMSAQAYLERWYSGLGWVREGEYYTEAGLPHVRMVLPGKVFQAR